MEDEYNVLLERYEKAIDFFKNKCAVEDQNKYYDELVKIINRLSEIEYERYLNEQA